MLRKKFFLFTFVLICLISFLGCAKAAAPSLDDDTYAFSMDNPQGFVSFCWQAAKFYQDKADFSRALSWVEHILDIQQGNAQALFYKAQILLALGRNEECQRLLEGLENEPALKDSPLLVSARGLLYQSYKNTGKLKDTEAAVRKELKGKKIDIDTYRKALVMMRVSESFDEIIGVAKKAIKEYPDESSFHIALAYAYGKKGKTQSAKNEYLSLINKKPSNPSAYFLLRGLLIEKKEFESAVKIWRGFVDKYPKDVSLRAELAEALCRAGKKDEGLKEYKICAQLAPGSQAVLARVRELEEKRD